MVTQRTRKKLQRYTASRLGAGNQTHGQRHHRADLTDGEVEQMRQLHEGGMGVRELGRKFDQSPGQVCKIVNFKARRG